MQKVNDRIDKHKANGYRPGHFRDDQIAHLQKSANRQKKIIARVFWAAKPKGLTPSETHKISIGRKRASWPLTSTRRAISNLTDNHILVKTEQAREGNFGRPERIWRWKQPKDFKKEFDQSEMFGATTQKHAGAYSK